MAFTPPPPSAQWTQEFFFRLKIAGPLRKELFFAASLTAAFKKTGKYGEKNIPLQFTPYYSVIASHLYYLNLLFSFFLRNLFTFCLYIVVCLQNKTCGAEIRHFWLQQFGAHRGGGHAAEKSCNLITFIMHIGVTDTDPDKKKDFQCNKFGNFIFEIPFITSQGKVFFLNWRLCEFDHNFFFFNRDTYWYDPPPLKLVTRFFVVLLC